MRLKPALNNKSRINLKTEFENETVEMLLLQALCLVVV
jgi:hypothetical protein